MVDKADSLKAQLLAVAPVLGTTSGALYEVQRALVRSGALAARPGRGRGSGATATPENLAMVLAAWYANLKPGQIVAAECAAKAFAKKRNAKSQI